ncbi:MAG: hypothetical protein Q8K93_06175, partial [Reyranella sp.]|nr:hypothetical protein [Reyranella sp.]
PPKTRSRSADIPPVDAPDSFYLFEVSMQENTLLLGTQEWWCGGCPCWHSAGTSAAVHFS